MVTRQQRRAGLLRQIARTENQLAHLRRHSDQLSNVRLLVALAGIVVVSVLFFIPALRLVFWLSLVAFGGGFTALVIVHRRVLRHIDEYSGWRHIKQTHLARMELDWQKIPPAKRRKAPLHMLEADLDLHHLHRLINTATSQGGSDRLREWLIPTVPDVDTIHRRQNAVSDLIGQPLFRDKLTLYATLAQQTIRESGEGRTLLEWLSEESPQSGTRPWLILLASLAVVNILLFIAVLAGVIASDVLVTVWGIYALIFVWQLKRVQTIFEDSLTIEAALRRLDAVMRFLERDRYAAMPHVAEITAPLVQNRPSKALRDATGVISGASLRANPIFWLLFNAVIPWDYYFAYRLESLKARLQQQLPQWLDIWHEIEALNALATLAYLNPSTTVPDVSETASPVFTAQRIGHPLIESENRITNSFTFQQVGETVIITGSNMSGKSSFLRTLGVNLALAYAGGRVFAEHMATSTFRLYTSIRVTDSLDDGISYFYAEVRRLRGLLDAIAEEDAPPVFYMIDEIFRGTNNRERLIGSRSYIQELAQRNCVGLVATHDLELVKLADGNALIRNFHFREDVEENRMVFDYTLREGPSPTTNALRIMQMEGLPVEVETDNVSR
ncbi:MAG: MutS family DNA mismatch repair protein [Chloroflexota bacterium]